MRIIFFSYRGTIGARCLQWLLGRADAEVTAVVTWPDYVHPEIRIAVKEVLYDAHLPLYQPRDVNSPAFVERLRRLEPDLLVSMYFGKLFKAPLLALPRYGCVNIHNSLLPKYRGQAPSIWAIVNGDTETGQTMHYLDEGIDSGDIIAQKSIPISEHDTGYTLGQKLEDVGVQLFQEAFPAVLSASVTRTPQNHSLATYCRAPRSADARIDWSKQAVEVHNFVRAFTKPMSGAFTRLGGLTVRVWDAAVLDGVKACQNRGVPGEVVGIAAEGPVVRCGKGLVALRQFDVETMDQESSRLCMLSAAGRALLS